MSLVENEKTKLVANALDRASTAAIAVGIFTPMAAWLYNINDVRGSIAGPLLIFGIAGWVFGVDRTPSVGTPDAEQAEAMNWLFVFASVVMPVVIVAMGYAAVRSHELWLERQRDKNHPAE